MQNNTSATLTQTSGGKIYLHLPNKNYKSRRMIGEIKNDILHVSRDPDRHFFYRYQGYGFSYLLSRVPFKILCLHLNTRKLFITKRKALAVGRFLNFQKRRLERQLFVSPNEFYTSRAEAEAWDAEHPEPKPESDNPQTELFQ